jgi:hypothetical protein
LFLLKLYLRRYIYTMDKLFLRLFIAVTLIGLISLPLFAQGTTATVNGTVNDETGAVLPGVTVTAKNVGTGMELFSVTSNLGRYTITGLAPGSYEIRAELEGFSLYLQKGLTLNIGKTYTIDIIMKLGTVAETITVTGEAPLIETTRSEVGTVIGEKLIDNLPLLGRNFFNLALTVPGSSEQTYFDPTKAREGGIDGVSFGAGSGRENLVLVDGGDNNDDVVGSVLQFYPQDSIQEFEVITNRFDAQYGHTIGGVVNVITKSGTNDFSGGAYWLFRDKALNSIDAISKESGITEKPPFRQNIFGGYLGGPIVKDKMHFFFDYDHTIRPSSLTLFYDNDYLNAQYGGNVPTDYHQYLLVGKVTGNINDRNFFTARYAYQNDGQSNYLVGGVVPVENGGTGGNYYHSVLGKITSVISDNSMNEALYQFSRFLNHIDSNTPSGYIRWISPEINLGYNGNLPQETLQKKQQFIDNYSYHTTIFGMDHDFKAGVEYQHVYVNGYIGFDYDPSRFDRGYQWGFTWNDTADMVAYLQGDESKLPDVAIVGAGYGLQPGNDKNHIFDVYFKDDLQVTDKLTLNLGLHYGFEKGAIGEYHDLVQDHVWGKPTTDYNNIAPRFGFAYDVKGDGTLVLRGGYGHFYGQIMNNILLWMLGGALDVPLVVGSGGISNPGYGPNDVLNGTAPDPDILAPYPSAPDYTELFGNYMYMMTPNFSQPMVRTASIGASWDLGNGLALDIDFVRSWSRGDYTYFRPLGTRINADGELDPNGFDITENFSWTSRVQGPWGRNDYNGLLVGMRKRFEKDVTFQLSYTYTDHKGNVREGLFGQTDNRDFPNFSYNFGPMEGKRDHGFVASVVYLLPYEIQVGSILTAKSGFHYSGLTTEFGDLDGDGYLNNHYDNVGGRGGYTGYPYLSLDVRFSKLFTLANKYKAQFFFEVFNLTDHDNRSFADIHNRSDLTDTFGKSWQVLGVPRQAQLSLRLDF